MSTLTKKLKLPVFTVLASGMLLLGACAPRLVKNPAAEMVSADLARLQADQNLVHQAPAAMLAAEQSVRTAQLPERDKALVAHRVYLADHKVRTARALAQAEYAVEERPRLSEQGNAVRLDARTREADAARRDAQQSSIEASDARSDARSARTETESAKNDAYMARTDADVAQVELNNAQSETDAANAAATVALQQADASQTAASDARSDADAAMAETAVAKDATRVALDEADAARAEANRVNQSMLIVLADLDAKSTANGVLLTLGDVLFSTGRADLKSGTAAKLDKLVKALEGVPDRKILIEGFTDSVGSDALNMTLSQSRADSVSSYLSGHGIAVGRLTAVGKGEALPVAGNDQPAGRQMNRRVEITIENPL